MGMADTVMVAADLIVPRGIMVTGEAVFIAVPGSIEVVMGVVFMVVAAMGEVLVEAIVPIEKLGRLRRV